MSGRRWGSRLNPPATGAPDRSKKGRFAAPSTRAGSTTALFTPVTLVVRCQRTSCSRHESKLVAVALVRYDMRLNVHDFSGHPFQVQLSRALASAGHDVLHGYSSQFVTGHGRLHVTSEDAPTLRIEGLTAAVPMIKYN